MDGFCLDPQEDSKIEDCSLVAWWCETANNERNMPSETPVVHNLKTIAATWPNKDDDLLINITLGQQILIEWEVWMCPQKRCLLPKQKCII
jgi:hypothetical protein